MTNLEAWKSLEHLEVANHNRLAAAGLRREIAALPTTEACQHVIEALTEPDPRAGPLLIDRLLTAVRGIGHTKARALAEPVGVTIRRVRDLTPRQRRVVAAGLRVWVDRRDERAGTR